MITIKQLSFYRQQVPIFKNLDWQIPTKKWIALLGPSGVGKSTLWRLIAGLEKPYTGTLSAIDHKTLSHAISYMAQQDSLLPWLTVADNVAISFTLRGQQKDLSKTHALLTKMGLQHAATFFPAELSGGMRQRVALARTLLQEKDIILMDEPFAAVDAFTRYKLHVLARTYLTNKTVLFITHDPLEALRLADEIYLLSQQPAQLTHLLSLTSATPRDFNHPDVIQHQTLLFEQLKEASHEP